MKVGFYLGKLKYIFLLSLVLLQPFYAGAATNQASDKRISLKISALSIPAGIAALEDKAGCHINYEKTIFDRNSKISLDLKEVTVEQALTRILLNTRVGFRVADQQTFVLYQLPDPVKPGKVSGKVLDEKGETLPGASIKVLETGQGTQTATDGSYTLNLSPATYTLMISYISYQTQRITGVVITAGKNTPLDISMKPDTKGLKEVVVTAGYKKASTEGLLARQKNASEISNGISSEQISRTPDKNIGESLKRISGVSTVDNKFVLIRGIGERYNTATLDGTALPSTEAQSRNFSFDLIPANLVDNVVVSKTVTPDMNSSFGGGLIQINTKDIPAENFMSFTAGASYNDQATGKDFLSHKRGEHDYLGFDDGRRKFPEDLISAQGATEPTLTAQSKRFTNDNFTVYKYKAAPSQNYQFTIGRLLSLDTANQNKFGFTGSLSYRNTQNINNIAQQTRNSWYDQTTNTGNAYGFNTTLAGLLNLGLQLGKNRFSLRNTYTHMYDNSLLRIAGYDDNINNFDSKQLLLPNRIQEADDPIFTDLLQNKLSGQHQLSMLKIEWDLARTSINRKEKDLGITEQWLTKAGPEYLYFYSFGNATEPRVDPISRQNYDNKESHYSWNVSATMPFEFATLRNILKMGYSGNRKKADFNWQIVPLVTSGAGFDEKLGYLPIAEVLQPENFGPNGFQFMPWYIDHYAGKSRTHAGFVMLDNRLADQLRLVWGLRGEYYQYTEINNANNNKYSVFSIKPDPRWQWLPSANLTYAPLTSLNIRGAYSSSVVRPEMMDNSQFWRYSAYLGGMYGSSGLYSTRINSWDFKTEWFPGLGEVLSVGGFYKRFDKPAELTSSINAGGSTDYNLRSADWAKVYGLEFELRKNLSFINDSQLLSSLTFYGNLTLQKSEVRTLYQLPNPDPNKPQLEVSSKQKRPMYGQSPYLINAGLQYSGERLGLNLMYNKSGFKTYIVSSSPEFIEYERPREAIDAQISYRFMKKKLEIKLNAANLLNQSSTFYRNSISYEPNPDYDVNSGDISNAQRLKPGFTEKYDDGDLILFSQKFGRAYSTSITYTF